MTNSRKKGRRSELEYKEMLESKGEVVYLVKMPTKFSLNQDMFGLWDIFSIDPLTKQKSFVQVKTNHKPNLKPFIEFRNRYLRSEDKVIVAIKYNHKGWEEIRI